MSNKTSKKTMCALIAGCIAAQGFAGLFTASNKEVQANSSDTQVYSELDAKKTGGWYTNKAQRGLAMRKRILKYIG